MRYERGCESIGLSSYTDFHAKTLLAERSDLGAGPASIDEFHQFFRNNKFSAPCTLTGCLQRQQLHGQDCRDLRRPAKSTDSKLARACT